MRTCSGLGRVVALMGVGSLAVFACNDAQTNVQYVDRRSAAPQTWNGAPGTAPGAKGTTPGSTPPGTTAGGKRLTNAQRWAARRSRPPQTQGATRRFGGVSPDTAALSPLALGAPAAAVMNAGGQPDLFGAGNYANSPFVQVQGGGAAADAILDANPASATFGQVTGLVLASGGAGYAAVPSVTLLGGGGAGAVYSATVDLTVGSPTYQQVTGFVVVSAGAGYTSAPQVWIDGAPVPGTGVRKFVDTLPGLCGVTPTATNNLGQCMPLATPFSAAETAARGVPVDGDYYEIGLSQYQRQLHSDLPATTLRGYADLNPAGAAGNQYLGPVILAQRNRPVRVRFKNQLPTGAAGRLFLPTDRTFTGAGNGPDGTPYLENRGTLHLHGGNTPWISDGTPHQWTTPVGELGTNYKKGDSTRDVPDMPPAGDGEMTFYWTNQQSGRLMFYHDHSLGLTRLNVYAGEAAGYLLVDPAEEIGLDAATVPGTVPLPTAAVPNPPAPDFTHVLPLIIQEKTFVPDDGAAGGQLAAQDPTWDVARYGGKGQLWFPHVYTPNQNPADLIGANGWGRWDYGAWFWPAQDPRTYVANGHPFACDSVAYPAGAPPAFPPLMCPGIPRVSGTPEAFMDTPLVNGTAYPSVTIEPSAYRFQILTAGNDRTWNFGLYYAATRDGVVCKGNAVADLSQCTEVSLVPAVPHNVCSASVTTNCICAPPYNPAGCFPAGPAPTPLCSTSSVVGGGGLVTADLTGGLPTNGTGLQAGCWPTSWPTDGRDGGVPDPLTAGPPIIEIGTEGGLLPAPVVIPSTPAGFDYNRRVITVLNILNHGLLLGPAERADVVVDFSGVPVGSALILHNDGPAPAPAFDTRLDYYTSSPDQSPIGGAPSTPAGYGPNTRTVMQFKVQGVSTNKQPFSLPALTAALPQIFAAQQGQVIVPETAYPVGNGAAQNDTYSRISDTQLAYFDSGGPVGNVVLTAGGTGYTSAPAVFVAAPPCAPGPGCSTATAAATIGAPVQGIALRGGAGGSGYTHTPNVNVDPPTCGAPSDTCVPALATALLVPTRVANVVVLAGGAGYTSLPTVDIDPPGCIGCATAKAHPVMSADGRRLVQLVLDDPGTGYTADPHITISGGGGAGARADATVVPSSIASVVVGDPGKGYLTVPRVVISAPGGGGVRALADATLGPASVLSVRVLSGGAGYVASTAAPAVTFSGGGGAGATAFAVGQIRQMLPKTIQELFTLDYGRMNATLGVEVPFTNFNTQTTIPYGYADPPTELVKDGETQLWKITHNGVDTHFLHFHLFTVQLVNRVGWDGQIKPPDANELGWKDTVRMNPLEDVVVALKPYTQQLPFALPISIRPLDVTKPVGQLLPYVFANVDPTNEPATVTNDLTNFGFEYVWHCHILGHEENDMMRAISFVSPPASPTNVTATVVGPRSVDVTWTTDGIASKTGFSLQRATNPAGPWSNVIALEANAVHYNDRPRPGTYYYRLVANNAVGYTKKYAAPAVGWPVVTASSPPSTPSPSVTVP